MLSDRYLSIFQANPLIGLALRLSVFRIFQALQGFNFLEGLDEHRTFLPFST